MCSYAGQNLIRLKKSDTKYRKDELDVMAKRGMASGQLKMKALIDNPLLLANLK